MDEKTLARFWAKVEKTDGCWLWKGAVNSKGYGVFGVGTRKQGVCLAHRFSWLIAHGVAPRKNALHRCDNPPCVNPAHLYVGDQADNGRDVSRRRRSRSVKLTEEQAREALRRCRTERHSAIARELGVARSTITAIARGAAWTWLHEEIRGLSPGDAQAAGLPDLAPQAARAIQDEPSLLVK